MTTFCINRKSRDFHPAKKESFEFIIFWPFLLFVFWRHFIDALSKVIPVILLFLLGAFLRQRHFIQPQTVQDLKKLVVNITLPTVLVLTFSQVNLQPSYLIIVACIFLACALVLLLSGMLGRLLGFPSPYFRFPMVAFEAGMMGYAIFGAVFGAQNIYKFGVVDLGQVTFVFFVLVTAMERHESSTRSFTQTLLSFIKTPVILAILLGIIANQVGAGDWMRARPLTESLLKTMELLAAMTTPLIGLVIGYEMRLQKNNLLRPLGFVALRLLVWVPFGLLLNNFVVGPLLHLDRTFQAAVMTMMVLPPPFVIPLFMKQAADSDREFVVNAISLATLATLFAFTAVSIFYGA